MKFVDEFRDPAAARALVKSITELATGAEFKFMEVCGGHTHTIYRHGIKDLLPGSPGTATPDPALPLAYLLHSRDGHIRRALSNSFGFGGSNCSLILGVAT